MNSVLDGLTPQQIARTDTIVYVGAGDGASLEPVLDLRPRRLVAVEGDPRTGPQLKRWATRRATVEAHSIVLTSRGGPAAWHRYSLPWLNGMHDRRALRDVYPRLQALGQEEVPSRPFGGWLDELRIDGACAQANLLVLDAPGAEFDLLSEALPAALQQFHRIMIRQCGRDDMGAAAAVGRYLEAAGFDRDPAVTGGSSLWPVRLYRYEARAWLIQTLRIDCENLEVQLNRLEADAASERCRAEMAMRELDELRERIEGLRAGLHAALRRAAEQDVYAHSLSSEMEKSIEAVRSEQTVERQHAAEMSSLLRERDAEIQGLRVALLDAARQRDLAKAQLEDLFRQVPGS